VPFTIDSLQRCTSDVGDWCASRRLKLNEDKTEFMWCGSRASLKKIASNDLSLRVGNDVITSVNAVRDLGVTLDSELTIKRYVNKVASTCFYHIRRLKQIRRLIGPKVTATLMSAFVLSKVDYCNASWFAKTYDCTTSTCSERCSQTDRTCRSSRPRYKYAATITLASGAIPLHL